MTSRRSLPLLVAVVVVTSLVLSGGAFSAVTTERGVHLAVVDDEKAYLGLQPVTPLELPADETLDLNVVRLTNQFTSTLDEISVSVTEGDDDLPTVADVNAPSGLGPGDVGWITADIDCGVSGNGETVTITIEASGRDSVELARDVTIDCERPSDDEPDVERYEFKGCSEVWVVLATEPVKPFGATFQLYDSTAETTRAVDVSVRPDELETVTGFDDGARVYKFNVRDHLGHPDTEADKVLGAVIEGGTPIENSNQCAVRQRVG